MGNRVDDNHEPALRVGPLGPTHARQRGEVMSKATIERILANPDCPTLPGVAVRVLELASKEEVSVRQIAGVIENDPALAAKLLRTVNSSFFGLSRRCGSIQQALVFLGLHSLKALTLGFTLAKSIDGSGDDEVGFDFESFWRRSICAGAAAREIAQRHRRCDADEAFLSALIQDIGMVALWKTYSDRYLQVVDLTRGDHDRLLAIERRALDTDHAEIGAEMVMRWRFPPQLAEAIRLHHTPAEADEEVQPLARTIHLAMLAADAIRSKRSAAQLEAFHGLAREWFSISETEADALLSRIRARNTELAEALGLEAEEETDVDEILERAEQLRREQKLDDPALLPTDPALLGSELHGLDALPVATDFHDELARRFVSEDDSDGVSIGVMLIGVDTAREIHEAFGAHGLDAALTHLLDILHEELPRRARIFRFVGAEIAVMLPNIDIDELCRLSELARRNMNSTPVPFPHATGGSFPATVSVGVACFEREPELQAESGIETPDQLTGATMFALATARRTRNKVVVYRPEMRKEYEGR